MNKKNLEESKKRENVKNNEVKKNTNVKNKVKDNIKIDILDKANNKNIVKVEEGVYHDGKKLLYEPDEEFKSCCFSMDKEFVYYCGKMTISMSVLAFSFLMLQNPANDVAFYSSTISLLLGHFLNSPTTKNKEDKNQK